MAGVTTERFEAVVQGMVNEQQVRRFKFPRLLLRALGASHYNIAISGSPRIALEPFLSDLPFKGVYGSEFEVVEGVFTGEVTSIGDKTEVLRHLIQNNSTTQIGSIALGDTFGDVKMLDYADRPIMFNPSRTLASYGQEFGWSQVIEVKDRILAMRFDNTAGRYAEVELSEFISDLQSTVS